MRHLTIAVAATWMLAGSSGLAQSGLASVIGDAFDRQGQLRYREHHLIEHSAAGRRSVTVYRDAAGQEIGRMEANFARSPFAPEVRMVDLRFDIEEVVRREGDRVHLSHRQGSKTKVRRVEVRPGRDLVIGPGFDEFVRARWARLLAGERVHCDIAVASRQQVYGFRIERAPSRDPRVARFVANPDNALLRLFAPALTLEYDVATRQLVTYDGLSNIVDHRDRPQEVVIRYAAPESAAGASARGPVAADR